ncbi:uncharacterized protein LOC109840152 isoform X1 [Asparagus officinalis]|uniref:uncharacterized protein LOC109840152 isoform X1 n=1 Tax=Asparagus officinalis TaxID=4686 RepID=UPI00098E309F|nr:uncharacterized protein LOC109840152 isoform X1 [Asparagus officinalis]
MYRVSYSDFNTTYLIYSLSFFIPKFCFIKYGYNAIQPLAKFGHLLITCTVDFRKPTDSSAKMGCVSSKIMAKSASFREEFNRSVRRNTSSIDEIIISKNNTDQFVALLCTANTVTKKTLKEVRPAENLKQNENSVTVKERLENDIETINTWELLADLDEDNEGKEHSKSILCDDVAQASRSFRTVEDFDAMIEEKTKANAQEGLNTDSEKGPKRKAMAKELTSLKMPGFEFSRAGSLKEWLSQGGQVFSPGSYITPKFGNFVENRLHNGENAIEFDPELVEQFEQAMDQLTIEEEFVLKEIIKSSEDGNEERNFFDVSSKA